MLSNAYVFNGVTNFSLFSFLERTDMRIITYLLTYICLLSKDTVLCYQAVTYSLRNDHICVDAGGWWLMVIYDLMSRPVVNM